MNKNRIHSVLIDKISITLPVADKRKLRTKNRLLNIMQHYKQKDIEAKHYPNQKRYGNNFKLKIPTDTTEGVFNIDMSIYPQNKAHNFFRIEFNPSKLGANGGQKIMKILTYALGPNLAPTLFTHGRLTRLDLATNIRQSLEHCFVLMKGVRESAFVKGIDDEIESQILGSPASNKRLTLYNKRLEQGSNGRPWWRLEIVLRNLCCSVADLDRELLDHFKAISFYGHGFLSDSTFDPQFLRHVKDRGLNHALGRLDRNRKARYLRHLAKYETCPLNLQRLGFKRGLALVSFLNTQQEVAA